MQCVTALSVLYLPCVVVSLGTCVCLCVSEPYVRDWTLDHAFGGDKHAVASRFFNHSHGGFYDFKPEYCTEQKILVRVLAVIVVHTHREGGT